MNYETLSPEAQASLVENRRRELEVRHCDATISLKLAEASLEKGLRGAEQEVMDLNDQIQRIELSLTTLGKLHS